MTETDEPRAAGLVRLGASSAQSALTGQARLSGQAGQAILVIADRSLRS
jgi:hypothetical protein